MRQLKIDKELAIHTSSDLQPLIKNLTTAKKLQKEPETEKERIDKLVVDNSMFAISIAKKLFNPEFQIPQEDMVQYAMIGLMQAAQKYNSELGYTFTTYAVNWIYQAVLAGITEDKLVHIPYNRYQQGYKNRKALAKIAEEFEVEVSSVSGLPTFEVNALSMDAPIHTHSDKSQKQTRADQMGVSDCEYTEDIKDVILAHIAKMHFPGHNPERMRKITSKYILGILEDATEVSIKDEISYEFNLTEERSRQLMKKAELLLKKDPFIIKLLTA